MERFNDRGILVLARGKAVAAAFKKMLESSHYRPALTAGSAAEGRRVLASGRARLVLVYTPLADEFGVETAAEFARRPDVGVLLMVPSEIYDQARHKAAPSGVLVMTRQADRTQLLQAVDMLASTQGKVSQLMKENERLRRRLEDESTVNRAKCLLIEDGMTENEAHRWIEKQAMDQGLPRREIAEDVIDRHEEQGK